MWMRAGFPVTPIQMQQPNKHWQERDLSRPMSLLWVMSNELMQVNAGCLLTKIVSYVT